jgi:hypothetical protein
MRENTDNATRTEYIKGIFNNDYTQATFKRWQACWIQNISECPPLVEGEYENRTAQSFYDWGVIAQHFEAMRPILGELTDTMKPLPVYGRSVDSINGQSAEEEKNLCLYFFSGNH